MADVFEMVLANRLAQDAATAAAAGAASAADAAAAAANAEAVAAAAAAAAADANAVAVGGDVESIVSHVVEVFVGEGQTGTTPADARLGLDRVHNDLVNNTNAINSLLAEQDQGTSTGMSLSIDFSDYPDGAFPSIFTTEYSGPGTSQLIIDGGNAKWDKADNQNRDCLARIVVGGDTETDFQMLRGTMASPPEDTTDGGRPHFYACARVSTPAQAATDGGHSYVWARAWSVGSFFQFKGDIGCTVNGVEYVWKSGVNLAWSLSMSFAAGVGVNERQFQVWSGTKLVLTINEIEGDVATYANLPTGLGSGDAGKAWRVLADGKKYVWSGSAFTPNGAGLPMSKIGSNYRGWGSLAQLRRDNSGIPNAGGVVSGCSVADNELPSVPGTTAQWYRTSTGNEMMIGGDAVTPLPANFWQAPRWSSRDLPFDPATGVYTIEKDGNYFIRVRITLAVGMNSRVYIVLQINGATVDWSPGVYPSNGEDMEAVFERPLKKHDVVRIATSKNGGNLGVLTGEATGTKTTFTLTRLPDPVAT